MAGDVVELIMQDHREVERLFDELKKHPEKRPNLVPVLTTLLTAHSRAEEAEVYPAAKDEAGETEEVAHSQEEHVQADKLLEKLAAADPMAPDFDQVLDELVEAVTHHVEEEEKKVLPGIQARLSEERRLELGDAFLVSREKHLGQQPADTTKEQLLQQAGNADISGVSGLGKDELKEELRKQSEDS
ncbi:hemerythrin domain-containing protein [Kribbella sp. NBC_01245]|uniref:hemerythrin domain-containing protein n=1 Tax=Kribbella sp. NBC_01245 TaxID=2903578 RepID=UPI002E2B90B7|nr:hemerythrin domain-containing protein [Kribbella sp. NBC_01245]